MQQTRGKHSMFWWCASTKQGKRAIKNARVCAIWIIYALESATRFDRVGVLSSQAAQRRETERFVRSLADDEGFCLRVDYMSIINDITLVFGITNVNTLEPSAHRQTSAISAVIINPDSVDIDDGAVRNNDIALLRLSSPDEFTNFVRPACLAIHKNEVEEYRNCWVAGWGGLGTQTDFDPTEDG